MNDLKKENPLVSIIIPTFNSSGFINTTLNKVLQQTWQNVEIIVVDDGSKDKTVEIIKGLNNSKIKLIESVNKGASAARNLGLKNANGQFIQFLDADDYLSDDKIENQLNLLYANDSDVNSTLVFCSYQNDYGNKIKCVSNQVINKNYDKSVDLIFNLWHNMKFNVIHSYLIPFEVIKKAGFWNEEISSNDDGEFMSRVIPTSRIILYDKKSVAYYVFTKSSLSKTKNISNFESRIKSNNLILENIMKFDNSDRFHIYYQRAISDLYVESIAHDLNVYYQLRNKYKIQLNKSSYTIFRILLKIFGENKVVEIYPRLFLKIDTRIRSLKLYNLLNKIL